jgi:cytochrome bd ubiquinol oxidase subunit II
MLETIWFILWGVLWAVYFMLDGFDLGIGSLYPFLGREPADKSAMLRAMGPHWDGNEVWLITAGGVTFAAFPGTYAVMFSALYSPLLLLLFGLIFRGVAMEFRSQVESPTWRGFWDLCLFLGSVVPALLLGVAFANIFQGIPIDKEGVYHGTLFTLLNPYGLAGGALFVLLFAVHGALWLCVKTEDALQSRAVSTAASLWVIELIVAVVFLIFSWFATDLYKNYLKSPALFLILVVTVIALLGIRIFIAKKQYWKAWAASAVTIAGATAFGVAGLFPRLLPSSISPEFSRTIHNTASSPYTLKIMLGVALVFVPLVIAYQVWSYILFKDKLTGEDTAHY